MAQDEPREQARPAFTCLRALDGGRAASLTVRAQPGAKRSGFAGFWNGMPKIAVTEPPDKGRANAAIGAEIARLFGLRVAAVTHVSGSTAREKTYRLECAPAVVEQGLARLRAEAAGEEA
ncbi:MAG: DUF167 domain-containing protein [Planctomycetes bacterium]|nr:DUF167 domain-containing protein [Planctomycetota bacterium]